MKCVSSSQNKWELLNYTCAFSIETDVIMFTCSIQQIKYFKLKKKIHVLCICMSVLRKHDVIMWLKLCKNVRTDEVPFNV